MSLKDHIEKTKEALVEAQGETYILELKFDKLAYLEAVKKGLTRAGAGDPSVGALRLVGEYASRDEKELKEWLKQPWFLKKERKNAKK